MIRILAIAVLLFASVNASAYNYYVAYKYTNSDGEVAETWRTTTTDFSLSTSTGIKLLIEKLKQHHDSENLVIIYIRDLISEDQNQRSTPEFQGGEIRV